MSVTKVIYAQFVASGVAATGLTVTVDVYSVDLTNLTKSHTVTAGSATELADGWYAYRLTGLDLRSYDYMATFKTSGTADQKNLPALWSMYDSAAQVTLPDVAMTINTDGSVKAEPPGVTRCSVTSVTNSQQVVVSGTPFAGTNVAGWLCFDINQGYSAHVITSITVGANTTINFDEATDIQTSDVLMCFPSRSVALSGGSRKINMPSIPANWITAAGINASALNGKGDWALSTYYTQTRAGYIDNLDATISSRLAGTSYTAPDNSTIGVINGKLLPTYPQVALNQNTGTNIKIDGTPFIADEGPGWMVFNVTRGYASGVINSVAVNGINTDIELDEVFTVTNGDSLLFVPARSSALASGRKATLAPIPADWITAAGITNGALNGKGDWLKPTVAGRTLDVSANGEAGLDFANVANGTSTDLALRSITLSNLNGTALSISSGNTRTAVSISGGTALALNGATYDLLLTNDTIHAGATDVTLSSLQYLPTLNTKFQGITSLAQWLGLIAGKQVGNTTARTEIRATGAGSGTFDETTDSVQAIRDRGDTAWTTGAGGGGGASASEIADAVAQRLGSVSNVTVIGIVSGDTIEMVKGDEYLISDGREWRFTKIAGEPWPTDLAGHTVTLTVTKAAANANDGDATQTCNGTIDVATGDSQSVYFEPNEAFTDGLAIGVGSKGYDFDVVAIRDGVKKTLRLGLMTVRKNQTTTP